MQAMARDENQLSNVAGDLVAAHRAIAFDSGPTTPPERGAREDSEHAAMALGATRAEGAGNRPIAEEPDRFRTCFERDLDRIKHSKPFRRLAGKCQVFIAPDNDHLRNRLTHAIEVAQVAVSIARPLGLNVALTEASALGHDCGHGPAGHASEDALSPFMADGYHHAVYGADVVLKHLNLCDETTDAIRNHSWNRPSPSTPEGEVVAWADRIAYVCHDFEDAVSAGLVTEQDLPESVTDIVGGDRRTQLHRFITSFVDASAGAGAIGLDAPTAGALAAFRQFNYDRIYLRPDALSQATNVINLLQQLTEWLIHNPGQIGDGLSPDVDSATATAEAVRYVSGMTDRFALTMAVNHLGWSPDKLPRSV